MRHYKQCGGASGAALQALQGVVVVVVIVVGHRNITLKFDQNWVNNESYIVVVVVVIVLVLLLIQNTSFKT